MGRKSGGRPRAGRPSIIMLGCYCERAVIVLSTSRNFGFGSECGPPCVQVGSCYGPGRPSSVWKSLVRAEFLVRANCSPSRSPTRFNSGVSVLLWAEKAEAGLGPAGRLCWAAAVTIRREIACQRIETLEILVSVRNAGPPCNL
jgi:hypothetical protein